MARKAWNPADSARSRSDAWVYAVSAAAGTLPPRSGSSCRTLRMREIPSSPGIPMSETITSGGSPATASNAEGAEPAVDTRVKGDPWQLCNVLVYKDTLIVKNTADLICVKMDFRTDGKGKLWQEK